MTREELEARIAKLEARLEIDHAFRSTNEHPEPQRYEIPPEERDNFPDGIECRDETIKILREIATTQSAARQQLEEDNARLRSALLNMIATMERSWDYRDLAPDRELAAVEDARAALSPNQGG